MAENAEHIPTTFTDMPVSQRSVRSLKQLFDESIADDEETGTASDDSEEEIFVDAPESSRRKSLGGFTEVAGHFDEKFGPGSSRIFWKRKQSPTPCLSEDDNVTREEETNNAVVSNRTSRLIWKTQKPNFLTDSKESTPRKSFNTTFSKGQCDYRSWAARWTAPNSEQSHLQKDDETKTSCELQDLSDTEDMTSPDLEQQNKDSDKRMPLSSDNPPGDGVGTNPLKDYMDKMKDSIKLFSKEELQKFLNIPYIDMESSEEKNISAETTPKTSSSVKDGRELIQEPAAVSNQTLPEPIAADSNNDNVIQHESQRQEAAESLEQTTNIASPSPRDLSSSIVENTSYSKESTHASANVEDESDSDFLKTTTEGFTIAKSRSRWKSQTWSYKCAKDEHLYSRNVKWFQHRKLASHDMKRIYQEIQQMPDNQGKYFQDKIPFRVSCAALGQTSGRIMVTGRGSDVNVWVAGRPNSIVTLSTITRHANNIDFVTFGFGEELIAAGTQSGAVAIWDVEHSKNSTTLTGHSESIKSLDFYPTGKYFASGSLDQRIRLWDIRNKGYGCIKAVKYNEAINSVIFSPDGKWLASAGEDGCVKLWDLTAGKLFKKLQGDTCSYPITALAFHPHELLLASSSLDRNIQFWDLETFNMVSSCVEEIDPIRMIFHPDRRHLVCGCRDELKICGWEPTNGYGTVPTKWGEMSDMAFCNNELIAATVATDQIFCYAVNLETLQLSKGVPVEMKTSISSDNETHPEFRKAQEDCEVLVERNEDLESPRDKLGENRKTQDESKGKRRVQRRSQLPVRHRDPPGKLVLPLTEQTEHKPTSVEPNEQDVLDAVTDGHKHVLETMSNRSENLDHIRKIWGSGNTKGFTSDQQLKSFTDEHSFQTVVEAVDLALKTKDNALFVNLLPLFNRKSNFWILDLCVLVIPSLKSLLCEKEESYVRDSISCLKTILIKFGTMVKDSVGSYPEIDLDVKTKERNQKCCTCHTELASVKDEVERRRGRTGAIPQQFSEQFINFRHLLTCGDSTFGHALNKQRNVVTAMPFSNL